MPTKKKSVPVKPGAPAATRANPQAEHAEDYEQGLAEYSRAIEAMRRGEYPAASEAFRGIVTRYKHEPQLAERSLTYARICDLRVSGEPEDPTDDDGRYHRAVMLLNAGRPADAVRLLDVALRSDPTSARCLYARASAWALQGRADAAVADLRQAISTDPKVRFQAANDPDFERIREEPHFIDVIEPTPTGA